MAFGSVFSRLFKKPVVQPKPAPKQSARLPIGNLAGVAEKFQNAGLLQIPESDPSKPSLSSLINADRYNKIVAPAGRTLGLNLPGNQEEKNAAIQKFLDPIYQHYGVEGVKRAFDLQLDPRTVAAGRSGTREVIDRPLSHYMDAKDTGSGYELIHRPDTSKKSGVLGFLDKATKPIKTVMHTVGSGINSVVEPIAKPLAEEVIKPVGKGLHEFADAAIGPAIQIGAGALMGHGLMQGIGSLGAPKPPAFEPVKQLPAGHPTGPVVPNPATVPPPGPGIGLPTSAPPVAPPVPAGATGGLGLQLPQLAPATGGGITPVSQLGLTTPSPVSYVPQTPGVANLTPPPNTITHTGGVVAPTAPPTPAPPVSPPTVAAPPPAAPVTPPVTAPPAAPAQPPMFAGEPIANNLAADLTFDQASNSFLIDAVGPGSAVAVGEAAFPGSINSPEADKILNAPLGGAAAGGGLLDMVKDNPMAAMQGLSLLGGVAGIGQPSYDPPPTRRYDISGIPRPRLPDYSFLNGMGSGGANMETVQYAPGLYGARLTPQFAQGLINMQPQYNRFTPEPIIG